MLALDAGRLEEFSSEAVGAVGARDTGRPAPISEPARVPFAVAKRADHSHSCLSSRRRTPGAWVPGHPGKRPARGRAQKEVRRRLTAWTYSRTSPSSSRLHVTM